MGIRKEAMKRIRAEERRKVLVEITEKLTKKGFSLKEVSELLDLNSNDTEIRPLNEESKDN